MNDDVMFKISNKQKIEDALTAFVQRVCSADPNVLQAEMDVLPCVLSYLGASFPELRSPEPNYYYDSKCQKVDVPAKGRGEYVKQLIYYDNNFKIIGYSTKEFVIEGDQARSVDGKVILGYANHPFCLYDSNDKLIEFYLYKSSSWMLPIDSHKYKSDAEIPVLIFDTSKGFGQLDPTLLTRKPKD